MATPNNSIRNLKNKKASKGPSVTSTDENIFVIHSLRNKVHPKPGDESANDQLDHDNLSSHQLSTESTPKNDEIIPPVGDQSGAEITKLRKSFLRTFVRFAPYLLLRPLRKEDAVRNKYAIFLQRVLFFCFNVIAFLNTLGNIKEHVLQKNEMNVLRFYSVLLYFANNFILRLCCIYITCQKWKGLHSLSHQKESVRETESRNTMVHYSNHVVVALVIVSLGVAFVNPIVEAGIAANWDGDHMAVDQAAALFAKIFKWDTETTWKQLFHEYARNHWKVVVSSAIGHTLMEFVGDLQLHLMLDLSLTAAMTLHQETHTLRAKIKRSKPSDYSDESKTKEVLLPYYDLRSFHETLDETFNFTLQFLILDNLLFCVYMACNHGLSETATVLVILDMLILVKVGWFIISSVRAASVNDVFRKWVRTSFPPDAIFVSNEKPRVTMVGLLDEITNDPIGFGSSIFFMNRGFIFGFLRSVTSGSIFFYNLNDD